MKMHNLSKKTLAIFLSLTMLMSCMVWSGVSAETNWNVFTCNFDTQPVKNADGSDGAKAAGYKPDFSEDSNSNDGSVAGSGDNSVTDFGAARYILDGGVGYMKLTKTAASDNSIGFRLYGDAGSWQTTINGDNVVMTTGDKSRALSGVRYLLTFDYKVVACETEAMIDVTVLAGAIGGGYATSNNCGTKTITSADVSDQWVTHSFLFTAPSTNAWLMGLSSTADGNVEVHIDNIVMEYMPDSRVVTNTFHNNDGINYFREVASIPGTPINLPEAPTREGFAFVGWQDADGVQYTADTLCPDSAVALYAQWRVSGGETHETDAYKAFWNAFANNNGTGYAKGTTGNLLNGNGSGRILSYLHNYDATTGKDVPGTAADGGYSVAISLSGGTGGTSPKHQLMQNGAKTPVKRGNDYVVSFMAYTETAKSVPFQLGTTYTDNGNLQTQTAYKIEDESRVTVSLPANEWTMVTLTVTDLVGYRDDTVGDTLGLTMFLNVVLSDGDYLYIDNVYVREYDETNHKATGMDFEELDHGKSLNMVGTNTTYVSTSGNHTAGEDANRSLYVQSNHGGATRAQWMVTDHDGNYIQMQEGFDYRVSFWIMRPNYDAAAINWWLIASDDTTTWSSGTDKSLRCMTYGTSSKDTEWSNQTISTGFVWTQISLVLEDVKLKDASKTEGAYLRMGLGSNSATAGTFLIDDIVVEKMSASEDTMTMEYVDVGTDLDIRNSGFTGVVSADMAHTGSRSLMVSAPAGTPRTGNQRAQFLLTNDLLANQTVELGKNYLLTFWVYMDSYGETGKEPSLDFWLTASAGTGSYTDTDEKENAKIYEAGAYVVPLGQWTRIRIAMPAVSNTNNEGGNLLLGINATPGTTNGISSAFQRFYIDDICVEPLDGSSMLNDITSGYQYVAGGDQDGNVEGETTPGSAIYVQEGTEKTAFRVAATYTADQDGVTTNKLRINGLHYEIRERGMLLGKADNFANADKLSLDTTADQGLVGKVTVTGDDLNNYWEYDADTQEVTYTILVRGVTKALKDTKFVARSYMRVYREGVGEFLLYSDMSVAFSAQGIYDGTDGSAAWFAEAAE